MLKSRSISIYTLRIVGGGRVVGLAEALGNVARAVYCSTAGPIATGLGVLGNVYKGFGGEDQGDDLLASAQLYRSGQQAFCNRPPDDVSTEIAPEFAGGQCVGDFYRVFVDAASGLDGSFNNQAQTTQFGDGPIDVFVYTDTSPGNDTKGVRISFGDGSTFDVVATNAFLTGGTPNARINDVQIDNLTDPADPCGDPPPEVPEYNPDDWSGPQPVTYDDDGGNPVTINPTFTFEPHRIGPGGDLIAPVQVTFENNINLNGTLNINTGDFNLFDPTGGGDGGLENPGPGENPDPGEEGTGEIVGVHVVSTRVSDADETTEIGQGGGNVDVYVPRTAHVAFRYPISASDSAWGTDISVKNLDFVAWADRPALEVRGTAQPGWSIVVTPIVERVESCCD